MRVVVLVSGGLDSLLAFYWCKKAGYDCRPIHFHIPFTKRITIPIENIKYVNIGKLFINVVRKPLYGYGKNLNPCIDCRILMLKKAKSYLKKIGGSFVVTGDVLGQRPMSQFLPTILMIDETAGLTGLVVRPLSGQLLPETVAEKKGWVERQQFMDIQGRSRKRQLMLAEKYGVPDYLSPAGGCLLTDRNFSERLRDELNHNPDIELRDIELLKVGRHFRFDSDSKLVVGRNEKENELINELAQPGEILMEVSDFGSPVSLLIGDETHLEKSAEITKKYSDGRSENSVKVVYRIKGSQGGPKGELVV